MFPDRNYRGKRRERSLRYQEKQVRSAIEEVRRNEKKADVYTKVVYWSDEDGCFVGMCPELIFGGVHGDDALKVFIELNQAMKEAVEILEQEGRPLPEPKTPQFETA